MRLLVVAASQEVKFTHSSTSKRQLPKNRDTADEDNKDIMILTPSMKTFLASSSSPSVLESVVGLKDNFLSHELLGLTDQLRSIGGDMEMSKDLRERLGQGLKSIEVLKDGYVWENLNIGHWKSVDPGWRRVYTYLSICKAIFLAALETPFLSIIKEVDMGLIMGEPILDDVLGKIALEISNYIRSSDPHFGQGQGEATPHPVIAGPLRDSNKLPQFPDVRFAIDCAEKPSIEEFLSTMGKQRPLLINGAFEHWPSRKKWDAEYIRRFVGFRTVPVEIGSKYTADDWTQKLMTIEDFVQEYMTHKVSPVDSKVGYIAQHHLFDQLPELREDIKVPEYCFVGEEKNVEINAWFGPAGTVSPTHFDPKHNMLTQIFGTKLIRLYPPDESAYLHPYPADSILFNTSTLDIEDPQTVENYPDFQNAQYCEFLLTGGQMLYMPPKWWHYVKSLTPSFSVSFWFQ